MNNWEKIGMGLFMLSIYIFLCFIGRVILNMESSNNLLRIIIIGFSIWYNLIVFIILPFNNQLKNIKSPT